MTNFTNLLSYDATSSFSNILGTLISVVYVCIFEEPIHTVRELRTGPVTPWVCYVMNSLANYHHLRHHSPISEDTLYLYSVCVCSKKPNTQSRDCTLTPHAYDALCARRHAEYISQRWRRTSTVREL